MPGRISAAISASTFSSRMRAATLMASQIWEAIGAPRAGGSAG